MAAIIPPRRAPPALAPGPRTLPQGRLREPSAHHPDGLARYGFRCTESSCRPLGRGGAPLATARSRRGMDRSLRLAPTWRCPDVPSGLMCFDQPISSSRKSMPKNRAYRPARKRAVESAMMPAMRIIRLRIAADFARSSSRSMAACCLLRSRASSICFCWHSLSSVSLAARFASLRFTKPGFLILDLPDRTSFNATAMERKSAVASKGLSMPMRSASTVSGDLKTLYSFREATRPLLFWRSTISDVSLTASMPTHVHPAKSPFFFRVEFK